jgi:23S rRNA pseudouridine1911/1915/1917 synthase
MSEPHRWQVECADEGDRLDRFLSSRLDFARNRLQHWIADGLVTIDGRPTKASHRLRVSEKIVCTEPDAPTEPGVEAQEGPLNVLFVDPHIIVLDKPAGLTVHPGAGRPDQTLANHLLHHFPEIAGVGGPGRPGVVHRLDKDTSGVLVVARTVASYRALATAFANRSVEKTYLAVVYDLPAAATDLIDLPIGRHPHDRTRMSVRSQGRPSRTRFRVLAEAAACALLEVDLETGRTHQIRVHLKARNHPLVGDPVYGEARWRGRVAPARHHLARFSRPALHAWRLAFAHPADGSPMHFEAPVPDDLRTLWQALGGTWPPTTDRQGPVGA